jgi:hypothetical protein
MSLLGRYALGVLDPDENELVARHVQTCQVCLAELAGYDDAIGLLPYAVPIQQVPIRARAGLLAKLDEIGTTNHEQLVALPAIPRQRRSIRSWLSVHLSPRMAAFAAVPLVLILAIVGIMANVINDQQQQIASIESEQAAEAAAVEKVFLGNDSDGLPAQATFINSMTIPEARAKLIVNHDTNSALILAKNLPAAADGRYYVAWLRITTADEYARAGVLQVDEEGRANLSVEPPDAIEHYTEVVVTIETDPEAAAPTGPQIMTAAVLPGR